MATDNSQEGNMTQQTEELNTLELQLTFGMDENGQPLTDAKRAQLEARVQALTGGEVCSAPVDPNPSDPTEALAAQMAALQAQVAGLVQGSVSQPSSIDDFLLNLDPKDSETALKMFEWLMATKRLQAIGNINGGGYLLHYSEPKGTTMAGYTPGATKGGQIVDKAVEQARASGAKPRKTGMCDKCWSAVEQRDDGTVVTDDESQNATCSSGGQHNFNG